MARLVCCTSGDAGADDATIDPLELARTREAEQRAAAHVVGYEGVDFLHRPDGALENDLALREQLVRIIRSFKPDAVVCMDPTVVIHDDGFIQHVDHRNAALAAVDAVYPAARNAMAFPHLVTEEGLEPFSVQLVYLFFSDKPNAWVDVTDDDRYQDRRAARARQPAAQARGARGDAARLVQGGRFAHRRRRRGGVSGPEPTLRERPAASVEDGPRRPTAPTSARHEVRGRP